MKNNMQKGFTLIELMIVVAIIGILASIAIPQYQNYIAKSQMTRVVGELSALKTSAETQLMEGVVPSTAAGLGFTSSDLLVEDASSVRAPEVEFDEDTGAGTIEGTLGGSASTAVKGAKVVVNRTAAGLWSCWVDTTDVNEDAWKPEFAPKGCPVSP